MASDKCSRYFADLTPQEWRDSKPFRDRLTELLEIERKTADHVLSHPKTVDRSHSAGRVWSIDKVAFWIEPEEERTDE